MNDLKQIFSHRSQFLVAGLLSLGLIAAVSTFAAGPSKPAPKPGTVKVLTYLDKDNGGKREDVRLGDVTVAVSKKCPGSPKSQKTTASTGGKLGGTVSFKQCIVDKKKGHSIYGVTADAPAGYTPGKKTEKKKMTAGKTVTYKFYFKKPAGNNSNSKVSTKPLYRLSCDTPNSEFKWFTTYLTTSAEDRRKAKQERGCKDQAVEGHIFPTQVPGTVPLHQVHNPKIARYYYTTDEDTLPALKSIHGYDKAGITGYIHSRPVNNTVPLYHLFSFKFIDHGFTIDSEVRRLAKQPAFGYGYETVEGHVYKRPHTQAGRPTPPEPPDDPRNNEDDEPEDPDTDEASDEDCGEEGCEDTDESSGDDSSNDGTDAGTDGSGDADGEDTDAGSDGGDDGDGGGPDTDTDAYGPDEDTDGDDTDTDGDGPDEDTDGAIDDFTDLEESLAPEANKDRKPADSNRTGGPDTDTDGPGPDTDTDGNDADTDGFGPDSDVDKRSVLAGEKLAKQSEQGSQATTSEESENKSIWEKIKGFFTHLF